MKMNKHLILILSLLFLIGLSGCTSNVTIKSTGGDSLPSPEPERGDTITITNCKANPDILQVDDGTEVTFVNVDSVDHTILYFDQQLSLPASGSLKIIASSPTGTQVTVNYLCDQQYAGAIFIV